MAMDVEEKLLEDAIWIHLLGGFVSGTEAILLSICIISVEDWEAHIPESISAAPTPYEPGHNVTC
jgi:hypothetical protein